MKLKEIVDDLNGKTRHRAKAKVAVGTSIGALAGAVAGILLAPKSGKDIRKDIKLGAERAAEKARIATGKAAKFAKEEGDSVSETITGKMNENRK